MTESDIEERDDYPETEQFNTEIDADPADALVIGYLRDGDVELLTTVPTPLMAYVCHDGTDFVSDKSAVSSDSCDSLEGDGR